MAPDPSPLPPGRAKVPSDRACRRLQTDPGQRQYPLQD
jgi:hypothetical protein